MRGDRRKMMPIGNISSRNFWRVRGQKTTAQVINSGGEATTTTSGTRPRTEAGRATKPASWLFVWRRSGGDVGGRLDGQQAAAASVAKRRRTFLCHALFSGYGSLCACSSSLSNSLSSRGHGSCKRTEEYVVGGWRTEATIKLGDSIWDTIKKASP